MILRKTKKGALVAFALLSTSLSFAQDTTKSNSSAYDYARDSSYITRLIDARLDKRNTENSKVYFSTLFMTRYGQSFTRHIDPNETYTSSDQKIGSFSTKHLFLSAGTKLTKNVTVSVMVDLADMQKSGDNRKVLDVATIEYNFNQHVHVIAGEFKPFIFEEDIIPTKDLRTFDFSHGYYLGSSMGWEGFQPGGVILGSIDNKNTFRYYLGMTNGNGSDNYDNNSNKNTYLRLEKIFKKNYRFGINGGLGNGPATTNQHGYIMGADFSTDVDLNPKLNLNMQAVWKGGSNTALYASAASQGKENLNLKDYKFADFYVFPKFRYQLGNGQNTIKSLEVSCRYEYYNPDRKINSNPEQSTTPLIGISLWPNYQAFLSVGMAFNSFKYNGIDNSHMNNNQGIIQFQAAF